MKQETGSHEEEVPQDQVPASGEECPCNKALTCAFTFIKSIISPEKQETHCSLVKFFLKEDMHPQSLFQNDYNKIQQEYKKLRS